MGVRLGRAIISAPSKLRADRLFGDTAQRKASALLQAALHVYEELEDASQIAASHFQLGFLFRNLLVMERNNEDKFSANIMQPSTERRSKYLKAQAYRHYEKAVVYFDKHPSQRSLYISRMHLSSLHLDTGRRLVQYGKIKAANREFCTCLNLLGRIYPFFSETLNLMGSSPTSGLKAIKYGREVLDAICDVFKEQLKIMSSQQKHVAGVSSLNLQPPFATTKETYLVILTALATLSATSEDDARSQLLLVVSSLQKVQNHTLLFPS